MTSGESSDDMWFVNYCTDMEQMVGRGWKRRLAEKVGVSESNVQTWLKSRRVPPAVRRAITLYDELEELRKESAYQEDVNGSRWIEEEVFGGEKRYSVHETNPTTGIARLVAGYIASIEDAREIANLPIVQNRIMDAVDKLFLENMYPDPNDESYVKLLQSPGWKNLTPREFHAKIRERIRKDGGLKEMFSAFNP